MAPATTDPKVDVSTDSGIVRVVIHPAKSWLLFLIPIVVLAALSVPSYAHWAKMGYALRGAFIVALVVGIANLLSRLFVTETIEISANKITVRKDAHGWERLRDYKLKECRELEWMNGSEDEEQQMQFKTGRKIITFGQGITEDQSLRIFRAIQETLPSAAQQLCTYPEKKTDFITLGLS